MKKYFFISKRDDKGLIICRSEKDRMLFIVGRMANENL